MLSSSAPHLLLISPQGTSREVIWGVDVRILPEDLHSWWRSVGSPRRPKNGLRGGPPGTPPPGAPGRRDYNSTPRTQRPETRSAARLNAPLGLC